MFHQASRVTLFHNEIKVAVNPSPLFVNFCHFFVWNSSTLGKLSNKEPACDANKNVGKTPEYR